MRYYVIMNGVNSLTIQGLAIRELPPISKPLMRNLREEIDGRNGDIITELGYSAYDKELEIGLYGNSYDINDIIAFFNGKGTITFSDEPDKYYYYQILNQIDYEKLLKFKTASVVFHCQPFKYKVDEVPLEEEFEYVEGEGTNITLNNTSNAIFNEFDLKGNTSQEGTPTPTNPIEVETTTGREVVSICGKNILDLSGFITHTNYAGLNISYSNGKLLIDGTATGNIDMYLLTTGWNTKGQELSNIINSQISYLTLSSTKSGLIYYFQINGAYIQNTINRANPTDNITNMFVRIPNGTSFNNEEIGIQLERNSQPSIYEEYKNASYPISLGDIELCKIGNYQDYFYKENNNWYIHKEIEKVILNGNENEWMLRSSTSPNYIKFRHSDILPSDIKDRLFLLTNYFVANGGANDAAYSGNAICGNSNQYAKWLHVSIDNTIVSDVATFKNWLSTHNVDVYYIQKNPTEEEITNEELINQLDALMLATSQDEQTNIIQSTFNLPFLIKVSALKQGTDHLIINNIGNIFAKPTLDLEGTGIVDIYLNDVEVFQVDLSVVNEIVLNTAEMEAYNPNTHQLANRQVTGDYSNFKLDVGENDLRFSGNLTKATVTYYQRWL